MIKMMESRLGRARLNLFRENKGHNWARGPYSTDKVFAYRYPLRLHHPGVARGREPREYLRR